MNQSRRCLVFVGIVALVVLNGCGKHGYSKINGKWVWVAGNAAVGRYEVDPNADTKSFVVLEDPQYAKDSSHVFFKGGLIRNADPTSFVVLPVVVGQSRRLFAKDRYHVFLNGFEIFGAAPDSYEVIKPPFGRDKRQVYCGTIPVLEADPATFQLTRTTSRWTTTSNKEFFIEFHGSAFNIFDISETHPAITSGGTWSKDATHHFFDAAIVEGADYDTFQPIDDWYGRDKDHDYHTRLRKEEFDRQSILRGEAAKARGEALKQDAK